MVSKVRSAKTDWALSAVATLFFFFSQDVGTIIAQSSMYPVCKQQKGSCACQTDRGWIDLSPLDSTKPNEPQYVFVLAIATTKVNVIQVE